MYIQEILKNMSKECTTQVGTVNVSKKRYQIKKCYKIILSFIVLLSTLFLQACGNDGKKYLDQYIKAGKYQSVHIIVNEYDLDQKEEFKEIIADVNNYLDIVYLLKGDGGNDDVEYAKSKMKEFNGSYKKYKSFKDDVKKLKNRIKELEKNRAEIDLIIQNMQNSYDKQDYDEMNKFITKYKENDSLVSDTSREQSEQIEILVMHYLRYQEEKERLEDKEKREQEMQEEWDIFWNAQEEIQREIQNNPPKDSIDTEMDITN